MLQLYWAPHTGVIAPEVMCEELGVDYERIPVDMKAGEHTADAYLRINPTGQVPAMILDDGTVVTESAAMVLLLGEREPGRGLVPPPGERGHAQCLRWLLFLATSVYGAFTGVYHSDRLTTEPAHEPEVRAASLQRLDRLFAMAGDAIEGDPWFLRGGYSALDIYLAMLADWHPEPARIREPNAALRRLCDAVEQRDAFARVMARHRA